MSYNLVAIREVSMDRLLDLRRLIDRRRLATTTRQRASHRRLISHRQLRLLFVAAADEVNMRSLLDLGLLGLLPLRLIDISLDFGL